MTIPPGLVTVNQLLFFKSTCSGKETSWSVDLHLSLEEILLAG